MRPSDPRRPRKRTVARRSALACFGILINACASPPPDAGVVDALRCAPLDPLTVQVQLVFGADADLDLYVTDPDQETVYFANTPSRLGGALEADQRCDAALPRVETIRFEAAPAGRYRVGVDFPERCGGRGPAPFALLVRGPGLDRVERGEVALGEFRLRVLEFGIGTPLDASAEIPSDDAALDPGPAGP